jgi:dihydrofolate reductase
MGKVIVFTGVTLDGVMQAPARPDEDRRGGFEHGGWAAPYAAMTQAGESIANMGALLLGRRTYEDFYAVWPKQTARTGQECSKTWKAHERKGTHVNL